MKLNYFQNVSECWLVNINFKDRWIENKDASTEWLNQDYDFKMGCKGYYLELLLWLFFSGRLLLSKAFLDSN